MKNNSYMSTASMNDFPKHIVLWGSGGHAPVVQSILQYLGAQVSALGDDNPAASCYINDVDFLAGRDKFNDWLKGRCLQDVGFLITFGKAYGNAKRNAANFLESCGIRPLTLVDPRAIVDPSVVIHKGAQILQGVIVQPRAFLGCYTILNTGSIVEHEASVADCASVAPGAILCGRTQVGYASWIGAGAVINTDIKVGKHSIVGAGAVVVHDVEDHSVVIGVPARKLRDNLTELKASSQKGSM